jgi:hypothetical protein
MKTEDWTEDEAFDEFKQNSNTPEWIEIREQRFPICIGVDDSREYSIDDDDDYLLMKHFLTVEENEDKSLKIVYYTSREPEGRLNEPLESETITSDYQWPVESKEHAHDMIPDFVRSMKFQ